MDHVNNSEKHKLSVAGIWFPLTMVVSIALGGVYFTWAIAQERQSVHSRIDDVARSVKALASTVDRLAKILDAGATGGMSRRDWLVECLQMQIVNRGWKCPYSLNDDGSWKPRLEQR